MIRTLTDELHVHLYGCLGAADVHALGRDRWRQQIDRLKWYEGEYERAWGRRPDAAAYWTAADGEERLAQDFEFVGPAPFAKFQACFNLLIALFPVVPGDTLVLRHVLKKQRELGIRYGEYRCFLPPHLSPAAVGEYVDAYGQETLRIAAASTGAFTPRLAFSLCRTPATALVQHAALRAALAARPALAEVVTGLDFCGVEEGNPPRTMTGICAAIHAANAARPDQALAILYHVGESFGDMSLASAMRWVAEAQNLGAHRLGHATALGLAPEGLAATNPSPTERVQERRDHLEWLLAEEGWLSTRGYPVDRGAVGREQAALAALPPGATVAVALDADALADAGRLQDAVLDELAARKAVVESCPTSNFRIGRINAAEHHPLPRFLGAGLRTVVGSDDPGIFKITLGDEEDLCRTLLGLDAAAVSALQATAEGVRAEHLARAPRPPRLSPHARTP